MYGIDDSLLLEMATVRGNYVKTDKIDFSFYYAMIEKNLKNVLDFMKYLT